MTSRGIRNNNPGNIDRGKAPWKGMSKDQSGDARFIVFDGPEWGIRAIARILRNYRSYGVDTIAEIISRWAPPVENDTQSYIQAVAKAVGADPYAPITDEQIPALVEAIIKHENGEQPYSRETIAWGIQLEKTA